MLTDEYLKRISRYADVTSSELRDESEIAELATGKRGSGKSSKLVLLDGRGKLLTSEELARFMEREEMRAVPLLFAIGGADGFSEETRRKSDFVLSLGKMTLPHELARVVFLEQLYRAFTILNHHPYHSGH